MKVGEAGESELIRRLLPHLRTTGLALSAGEDDAAAWAAGPGFTVVSCDASVEGVHFDLSWMAPEDVGWRALALALGDLAAKGATPTHGLVAVALPEQWELADVVGIYAGMARLAEKVGVALVGGDTTATVGPAVIVITVIGTAPAKPLPRSAAQAGWLVGVTGPLGGAALALRERRAHLPLPRIDAGILLNRLELCCGDISDGLHQELQKFADWAGAGATIRLLDIPRVPGVTPEEALASGEEAELVVVGPPDRMRGSGLQIVGELVGGGVVRVFGADGLEVRVRDGGHRHFG
ncbi:MAG: thiamine-phosphate kinase [Candidatus Dormibacteraceae bacterium]